MLKTVAQSVVVATSAKAAVQNFFHPCKGAPFLPSSTLPIAMTLAALRVLLEASLLPMRPTTLKRGEEGKGRGVKAGPICLCDSPRAVTVQFPYSARTVPVGNLHSPRTLSVMEKVASRDSPPFQ